MKAATEDSGQRMMLWKIVLDSREICRVQFIPLHNNLMDNMQHEVQSATRAIVPDDPLNLTAFDVPGEETPIHLGN